MSEKKSSPLAAAVFGFVLGAIVVKLVERFCPMCSRCCCGGGETCCCEDGEAEGCCGDGDGEPCCCQEPEAEPEADTAE